MKNAGLVMELAVLTKRLVQLVVVVEELLVNKEVYLVFSKLKLLVVNVMVLVEYLKLSVANVMGLVMLGNVKKLKLLFQKVLILDISYG